jgi:hypothetical protein
MLLRYAIQRRSAVRTNSRTVPLIATYCSVCVISVRFEVLTAASVKMTVFWVVAPCSLGRSLPTFHIALMEAARTSEPSLNVYNTTRRNNPEDSHLHVSCHLRYIITKLPLLLLPSSVLSCYYYYYYYRHNLYLFICGLFNDAVSSSDYIAVYYRMINEY